MAALDAVKIWKRRKKSEKIHKDKKNRRVSTDNNGTPSERHERWQWNEVPGRWHGRGYRCADGRRATLTAEREVFLFFFYLHCKLRPARCGIADFRRLLTIIWQHVKRLATVPHLKPFRIIFSLFFLDVGPNRFPDAVMISCHLFGSLTQSTAFCCFSPTLCLCAH